MLKKTGLIGLMVVGLSLCGNAEGEWKLEPLGPEGNLENKVDPVIKRKLTTRLVTQPVEGSPFVWAEQGEARCVLVLPKRPNGVEQSAASMLATTLAKITGGEFQVYKENEVKVVEGKPGVQDSTGKQWEYVVWIGATDRAGIIGITADDLIAEGYRIENLEHELYLVGNDKPPARLRPYNGTYFAVVALLEKYMGVRWLWPGELGTVIPSSPTLQTPAFREKDEPALQRRVIRNMTLNERAELGLRRLRRAEQSEHYNDAILTEQGRWLRNMRTGTSLVMNYGHTYGNWYKRYAEEHPEWFALQPDGTRIMHSPGRERLCKSNSEVVAHAAKQVLAEFARNPNLLVASVSPNDGGYTSFCMCEECRKLDPPNAPIIRHLFFKGRERFYAEYPALSDRMATFYNRIAEQVVAEKPDAILGAYAYGVYRDAPVGVTLHPSILIGFVGLGYWDESSRQRDLQRWDLWSHRATQLFLRPNIFHAGAGLPGAYPRALAEDIRHCYQTGMISTDFDSLIGHWSTQGLNYYVLARLLWDPSQDVEKMIQDYCWKGFGPAALQVYRYFNELETSTREVALGGKQGAKEGMREDELDQEPMVQTNNDFEQRYFQVFTPQRVKELRGILKEAARAADQDSVVLERIAFLKSGLDYIDLFREIRIQPRSKEAKLALLEYLQKTFDEQPLRLNSAFLMWRLPFGRLASD